MVRKSQMAVNDELFDLPGNGKPKGIWKAIGTVGRGKKAKDRFCWVQASSHAIASRVARRELRDVHRAKLSHLIPHTWTEYAATFRGVGGGVTVSIP